MITTLQTDLNVTARCLPSLATFRLVRGEGKSIVREGLSTSKPTEVELLNRSCIVTLDAIGRLGKRTANELAESFDKALQLAKRIECINPLFKS